MTRARLSPRRRLQIFEAHNGICHICRQPIQPGQRWEISHPIPIALGGADDDTNRAPAHKHPCHSTVTAARDIPAIAKAVRVRAKHIGAYRSSKPLPAGRDSRWSKKISGEVVARTTLAQKLETMRAKREVRGQ